MVHRAIKALIHNSKTEKVSLNNIVPTRLDRPSYPYDLEDINKGFDLMHAGDSIRSVVVF